MPNSNTFKIRLDNLNPMVKKFGRQLMKLLTLKIKPKQIILYFQMKMINQLQIP